MNDWVFLWVIFLMIAAFFTFAILGEPNYEAKRLENVSYVRDSRTNLCFAFYHDDWYRESVASIPCSDVPPQMLKVVRLDNK